MAASERLGKWQAALEACAAKVCNINRVEEDEASSSLCQKIPVPSLFGGAGRTTFFGRVLWCAALLQGGPVLDLYSGHGDSTALLAHALAHRAGHGTQAERLISFEQNLERASFVATRLQEQNATVHLADAQRIQQGHWRTFLHTSFGSQVSTLLVAGSTSDYLDMVSQALSQAVGEPGLLLLDPDVEMPLAEFARDWRSLEALNPRTIAIYNTNLPGGAGWVLNRLLALQTYVEIAAGNNDGGEGENDTLLQMRAWSVLLRVDAPEVKPQHYFSVLEPDVSGEGAAGSEAQAWIEEHRKAGGKWQHTTSRAAGGGEVVRIHRAIGGIVPVEVRRPNDDLYPPPALETNPHECLAETDPIIEARGLRVPCFLNCEGPDFDPRWGDFRRKVLENAMKGYPMDQDLVIDAIEMGKGIVESDEILIQGRSRFVARLRHEYTHDGHMAGFCLFGITASAFLKGRFMLGLDPTWAEEEGRKYFPPQMGLSEMDVALTMVSDSDSTGGIEFSFLENSGWALTLEHIISNLDAQTSMLGAPFQLYQDKWEELPMHPIGTAYKPTELRPPKFERLRICAVGDHLTATFDAVLMAESSLKESLLAGQQLEIHREFLGRYCPKHAGQGHQCKQRCALLGNCNEEEDDDPIARFLDGVIDPETLDELPFELDERREKLRETVLVEARLREADLLVCSHPTLLCMLLADASPKPLFVHASSTLLYGLRCIGCAGMGSNVRYYDSSQVAAHQYLRSIPSLLKRMIFVAEGRFLAEQIQYQVGVRVSWAPPLALYINEGSWHGQQGSLRRVVVLRSRFFVSLMGELLRSLLREIVVLNYHKYPLEVVFLGKDKQFEEQWLSLQQLSGFDAAILWPNDLHQRTFHEVYRMGMPLLMPDADGLYRSQKMSNWGYSSYGGRLATLGEDQNSNHPFPPWWNSFEATPEVVNYWERYADWQQVPHVQRFASLPGLVVQTLQLDLVKTSSAMVAFHRQVCQHTLRLISQQILATIPPGK